MAEVIWTEPALQQLDAVAEYIALDKPVAAGHLVREVFDKTERLEDFPQSGRIPVMSWMSDVLMDTGTAYFGFRAGDSNSALKNHCSSIST